MTKQFKSPCPELKVEMKKATINKIHVRSSKDINDFFHRIWEGVEVYESFMVVFLNRANNTIGWYKASQGGITGTVVDVRLIFHKALECLATGMVLCHNHPSGNLRPSDEDIRLTEKVKQAGLIMDIKILDHVIITPEDGYYSFADEGKL
jgi:DNA repair protein RadC